MSPPPSNSPICSHLHDAGRCSSLLSKEANDGHGHDGQTTPQTYSKVITDSIYSDSADPPSRLLEALDVQMEEDDGSAEPPSSWYGQHMLNAILDVQIAEESGIQILPHPPSSSSMAGAQRVEPQDGSTGRMEDEYSFHAPPVVCHPLKNRIAAAITRLSRWICSALKYCMPVAAFRWVSRRIWKVLKICYTFALKRPSKWIITQVSKPKIIPKCAHVPKFSHSPKLNDNANSASEPQRRMFFKPFIRPGTFQAKMFKISLPRCMVLRGGCFQKTKRIVD